MKKVALFFLILFVAITCKAQGNDNHLFAKVGTNYSFVDGGPEWAENNSSHRVGLIAGFEYERTFNCWGLSVGAMFSMQGERTGYWADGNNMFVLPVTLNYHIKQFPLALKLGMQYGRGKDLDDWSIPMGVTWRFKRFVIEAIYKHGISTKNHTFYDNVPGPRTDDYIPVKWKSGKSRTFTITIGYDLPIW